MQGKDEPQIDSPSFARVAQAPVISNDTQECFNFLKTDVSFTTQSAVAALPRSQICNDLLVTLAAKESGRV